MVDSQIHTMGVTSDAILDAFRTVPREQFVPSDRVGVAYTDEDMAIAPGRYLVEPVTHARLLQAALPVASDTALDIACGTGYSAAILGSITSRVVAVDDNPVFLGHAEKQWAGMNLNNIVPHMGALAEGCAAHGPYSLIVVNGSVNAISPNWTDQLAPEGRLVAVVKGLDDKIGRAILLKKSASGVLSQRILFDAAVPFLPGFAPKAEFVF
jgi:protein-L-isoaspartate(D-aspartate) O-methyltransferase